MGARSLLLGACLSCLVLWPDAGALASGDGIGWTIVGFTGDGEHVVFERERGAEGCLEISLEVFRADDNRHVVSVPLVGPDAGAPGCVARGNADAFGRAVTGVGEAFGPVTAPQRLHLEDGRWRREAVELSMEAQTQLPAEGCDAITHDLRARAHLRFELIRGAAPGAAPEHFGRQVEIAPVADAVERGCLTWPEVRLASAALREDGARLALVAAGLPLVLPLP